MKKDIVLIAILALLSGCSEIEGEKYRELQPSFKLEEYFNGQVKAWGIIQDRDGNVTSRFDMEMVGRWEGNTGVLEETFTYYNSDEVQKRRWEITKIDDTHYTATAGDIIGTAEGVSFGSAIRWRYEMDLPVDNSHYLMSLDDWMWSMNDGVVINRSYIKKFGITFAEITVFMQKS